MTSMAKNNRDDEVAEIARSLEEMAALGLIVDTGQRRNGQIVYRRTELFRRKVESGGLSD